MTMPKTFLLRPVERRQTVPEPADRMQKKQLEEAGFKEVEYRGITGFRTLPYTVGALFRANKETP